MIATTVASRRARIRDAESDEDRIAAFDVMVQLRPHLRAQEFVPRVRRMEREGFRLAVLDDGSRIRAVAGYRVLDRLLGRVLHVDDLVTDGASRSRGHGRELFEWLAYRARRERCERLELDSGVQRYHAHRFYLERRMEIRCHHFSLELAPDGDGENPPDGGGNDRAAGPDGRVAPPTGQVWSMGVKGLA